MKLLFFHGKGLINSLVRWQTNSHFAHVAIQPDGWSDIFEAVPKHGVRRRRLQPGEEYWESSFANVSVNTRSGRSLTFQSDFAYDFLQQQGVRVIRAAVVEAAVEAAGDSAPAIGSAPTNRATALLPRFAGCRPPSRWLRA
jgi:hypothetical protein